MQVNDTWIKTDRTYNTGSGWTSDLPSTFACGNFSTSFRIYNKGNVPGYRFNVTENKQNITVTHGDLLFYMNGSSDGSTANIIGVENVIFGSNGINLTGLGKVGNSGYYNYSINATYQTNGTFMFQGIVLNNTYSFRDDN